MYFLLPCFPLFPSILIFVLVPGENFSPWTTDFLQFPPASEPAYAPDAKSPFVLAANRTDRPDVLNGFRHYRGGWDITNRHYWAVSPLEFNFVVLLLFFRIVEMQLRDDSIFALINLI